MRKSLFSLPNFPECSPGPRRAAPGERTEGLHFSIFSGVLEIRNRGGAAGA
jgi:hypothetical protein